MIAALLIGAHDFSGPHPWSNLVNLNPRFLKNLSSRSLFKRLPKVTSSARRYPICRETWIRGIGGGVLVTEQQDTFGLVHQD